MDIVSPGYELNRDSEKQAVNFFFLLGLLWTCSFVFVPCAPTAFAYDLLLSGKCVKFYVPLK